MSSLKNAFLLLMLAITACHNLSHENEAPPTYQLDGRSTSTIQNQSDDSLQILLTNWYLVPLEEQSFDTTIAGQTTVSFELVAQNKNYYSLKLNEAEHKIFHQPGAGDTLHYHHDNEQAVLFTGTSSTINEYILAKAAHFQSVNADWKPRAMATHTEADFNKVLALNDSITKQHLAYLAEQKTKLPKWFVDFEALRLQYLNAYFKMNSFIYRKVLLNFPDTLPNNFFHTTTAHLPISNDTMAGNEHYMHFVNDYLQFESIAEADKSTHFEESNIERRRLDNIEAIQTKLTGIAREAYLTFTLSLHISKNKYTFNDSLITLLEDQAHRILLYQTLARNEILPKGADLPYVLLPDPDDHLIELESFHGNVLLINFWATWCKPCIKAFPKENALVEEFRDQPVKIINICLDSEKDRWQSMVEKHELKTINLFAQDNWNKKINESFDIQALPHSVLVDWNGKIVQNKGPKPGENAGKQINALLSDMKASKKSSEAKAL